LLSDERVQDATREIRKQTPIYASPDFFGCKDIAFLGPVGLFFQSFVPLFSTPKLLMTVDRDRFAMSVGQRISPAWIKNGKNDWYLKPPLW
jgi:hypothetical protein